MLNLDEVIVICLFIVGFIYWLSSQRVKEIALHATKVYCHRMDVQMLDGYIALNATWFKRDSQGKICFWRSYLFEFTATGNDRYNGKIVMLGHQIESIYLEPYRL